MHFLIVTHVLHKQYEGKIYAYGPYVREMNIWFQHVDKVTVLAPIATEVSPDPIDLEYIHSNLTFVEVPEFTVLSPGEIIKTASKLPELWFKTWEAMKAADHIHLRCPGNMGLVGSMVQIFFPEKLKTAKYAGNWDKRSQQPFTYKLQQIILSNTFLTKNMQVLVYGEWPNQSKNVKPFFTASYSEKEKVSIEVREIYGNHSIRLVFVGGLNSGKQPLISAKVCHALIQKGYDVYLDFYGEGPERLQLEEFINENMLSKRVVLHGNVPAEEVKKAFQNSHFLLFISQSEGWPKVVAEAMFWACVPITTLVSCVPEMVGHGQRGVLVNPDPSHIAEKIQNLIEHPPEYASMARKAMDWSRIYTLEKFEKEIQLLLQK